MHVGLVMLIVGSLSHYVRIIGHRCRGKVWRSICICGWHGLHPCRRRSGLISITVDVRVLKRWSQAIFHGASLSRKMCGGRLNIEHNLVGVLSTRHVEIDFIKIGPLKNQMADHLLDNVMVTDRRIHHQSLWW